MPKLSVWAIRLSLGHLLAGFTFGGLLLVHKGIGLSNFLWALLPAHIELLLFGWMMQLIIGVAYWILPRYWGGGRGNERAVWLAVALLNAGVLLVALQPLLRWPSAVSVAGRAAETGAAILFATSIWGRVKPTGA